MNISVKPSQAGRLNFLQADTAKIGNTKSASENRKASGTTVAQGYCSLSFT